MTKRKIMLLAMALSVVAILAVGGTLAYFTDTDAADNVFTVGNVDIDLTEPDWVGEDAVEPNVYPGQEIEKNPMITNNGDNPCFVRIKITGWDSLIEAKLSAELIEYATDGEVGELGDEWAWNEDDEYFYYTKVLNVGAETDHLFDTIVLPTDLQNGDAETPYTIHVSAEAVQAQGVKDDYTTATLEEIIAWFTTCMPAE